MQDGWERRVRELARRAGLGDVSPRTAVAAMVVLAVAVGLGLWRWWPTTEASLPLSEEPASTISVVTTSESSIEASDTPRLWVHVVGAVRHPGLYCLEDGARVDAAIDAAGGVLGNAAPEAVNLARRVSDGEQILIPTHDEAERGMSAANPAPSLGGQSGSASAPINLNNASAAQLDTLPGVGPATALKIVADRESNGPFGSVEDLGRVAGIGPKKLEELKGLVCVR